MTQNDQDHIAGRLASSIEALKETLEKAMNEIEIVEQWAYQLSNTPEGKALFEKVRDDILWSEPQIEAALEDVGKVEQAARKYHMKQEPKP